MLMAMRPFEVTLTRDLNLTSYTFSKNAEELQNHISRYPEIGQNQPFNPDVGGPFAIELARGQLPRLGDVTCLRPASGSMQHLPKIGKQLSEFESGE